MSDIISWNAKSIWSISLVLHFLGKPSQYIMKTVVSREIPPPIQHVLVVFISDEPGEAPYQRRGVVVRRVAVRGAARRTAPPAARPHGRRAVRRHFDCAPLVIVQAASWKQSKSG